MTIHLFRREHPAVPNLWQAWCGIDVAQLNIDGGDRILVPDPDALTVDGDVNCLSCLGAYRRRKAETPAAIDWRHLFWLYSEWVADLHDDGSSYLDGGFQGRVRPDDWEAIQDLLAERRPPRKPIPPPKELVYSATCGHRGDHHTAGMGGDVGDACNLGNIGACSCVAFQYPVVP